MTETDPRRSRLEFAIGAGSSFILLLIAGVAALVMALVETNCCDSPADHRFIHVELFMACGGLVTAIAFFLAVLGGHRRTSAVSGALAGLIYLGWGASLLITGYDLGGS